MGIGVSDFMDLAPEPKPDDTVQILMSEEQARLFEKRCLGGKLSLSKPITFGRDDVPSYFIQVEGDDEIS